MSRLPNKLGPRIDGASQLAGSRHEVPLFPLDTVLFSGGRLSLRLFEPRYLDMLARCLKSQSGFGVVLSRQAPEDLQPDVDASAWQGPEVPDIFDVGTYAVVVDFDQLEDDTLGIVCQGEAKFRVRETRVLKDGLLVGDVEFLPEERPQALSAEHRPLIDVLRELLRHPLVSKLDLSVNFDDARSVGWRLAELLPLEPEIKQGLLQMNLPRERLTELARLVDNLRG